MRSKKHREPPEFETIQAAIEGDAEAINQVLSYFQPFINSECRVKKSAYSVRQIYGLC